MVEAAWHSTASLWGGVKSCRGIVPIFRLDTARFCRDRQPLVSKTSITRFRNGLSVVVRFARSGAAFLAGAAVKVGRVVREGRRVAAVGV